jgi:hypothetical protein
VRRLDGLPYRVTDRDSGLRATRSGISEDAVQPFGGGADFDGIALPAVGRLTSTEGNCRESTTVCPIASQECTISAH